MKRFRISSVAGAGFLLLAPFSAAAARGAQEKASSKQPAQEQEGQVRGARDMAGDSYEILRFHTDDYFKVNFSAINFTPSGTMNPCKTVQGMYGRVHYYHIKGHPKEGELISVELRK